MFIFIPKLLKVYYLNKIKGVTLQNIKNCICIKERIPKALSLKVHILFLRPRTTWFQKCNISISKFIAP